MLTSRDFVGAWRVERLIHDRRAGRAGRFDGSAAFTPDGDELRYREEGTLRMGHGPALAATRDHLWRWAGTRVEVLFADGRPFHGFAPAGATRGTDHPCGADLYRVTYDFTAWPAWETVWHVTGPRKAYRLETAYRR